MKLIKITAALSVLFSFGLVACDKDDTNDDGDFSRHVLQQGTWRVGMYTDNGADKTADFNGYTFTFRDTGLVTAENALTSLRGAWNARVQEGEDRLSIRFPTANPPFSDLNEEWRVLEMTSTRVRLLDISSGGADLLTFERN